PTWRANRWSHSCSSPGYAVSINAPSGDTLLETAHPGQGGGDPVRLPCLAAEGAGHEPLRIRFARNDRHRRRVARRGLRPSGGAAAGSGRHGAGDRHETGSHHRRPANPAGDAAEGGGAEAETGGVPETGEGAENFIAEATKLHARMHVALTLGWLGLFTSSFQAANRT